MYLFLFENYIMFFYLDRKYKQSATGSGVSEDPNHVEWSEKWIIAAHIKEGFLFVLLQIACPRAIKKT